MQGCNSKRFVRVTKNLQVVVLFDQFSEFGDRPCVIKFFFASVSEGYSCEWGRSKRTFRSFYLELQNPKFVLECNSLEIARRCFGHFL